MSDFYWCLTHHRVERGNVCRAVDRMGPYESEEAARGWSERVESRDDAWQAEDERWEGPKDDEEDEDTGWL